MRATASIVSWSFVLALGVGGTSNADEIFKCTTTSPTTSATVAVYQAAPCDEGQIEVRVNVGPQLARAESDKPMEKTAAKSAPEKPAQTQTERQSPPQPAQSAQQAPVRQATSAPAPAQHGAWPFRTTLALGMTDDQVLNLPGWGRPSKIIRSKNARAWREEWVYMSSAAGEQHLVFVNTTLTEINTPPAPDAEPSAPLDRFASYDGATSTRTP